jgi:hypothetical protein
MRNYTVCAPSHMFAPAQNSFWVRPCLHHPPTKVRTTRLCTKGHILNNHQTSIHFRVRCLIFSSSHAWFYSLSHVSPQRIGSGAPHLETLANTVNGLGSGTPSLPASCPSGSHSKINGSFFYPDQVTRMCIPFSLHFLM